MKIPVAQPQVFGSQPYVLLREEQAQNVAAGTFLFGDWRTRTLNNEVSDLQGICALASSQITLSSGDYIARITCPAYIVDRNQARLQDVTNTVTLLLGSSMYGASSGLSVCVSRISGYFTVSGAMLIEVQHRCQTTEATYGLGVQANFGTEVYTVAEFWKVA